MLFIGIYIPTELQYFIANATWCQKVMEAQAWNELNAGQYYNVYIVVIKYNDCHVTLNSFICECCPSKLEAAVAKPYNN